MARKSLRPWTWLLRSAGYQKPHIISLEAFFGAEPVLSLIAAIVVHGCLLRKA